MHHSCFTRRRQRVRHTSTFPHQAPDVVLPCLKFPSGSAEGPFKKKSLRHNYLVKNCLLVLVSPAKLLRRPIFRGRTRHAVDLESLCLSLYKCTRFDIIAVLYTCTTVASRVAANTRTLTHARRSLWHRRLRTTHTRALI